MAIHENLPMHRSDGNFDAPLHGSNALNLNGERLRQAVSDISEQGITRDELIVIARRRITDANPLLSHVVGHTGEALQRNGKDFRSFTRGATLAVHLLGEALQGGVPVMDIGGAQLVGQYRNQNPILEDLRQAANGLLTSQEILSEAFDDALTGMPENTERDMARFGAGIIVLGVMATAQCYAARHDQ